MSLKIECGSLYAEVLNHPQDVYIYFDGGFFVWNCKLSDSIGVWFNGDMLLLADYKFDNGNDAANAINEFVEQQLLKA